MVKGKEEYYILINGRVWVMTTELDEETGKLTVRLEIKK